MDSKIQKTWRRVSHEQSEEDDLFNWGAKNWKERLIGVQELREMIWNSFGKIYPLKIEITGGKKEKKYTDEDDF